MQTLGRAVKPLSGTGIGRIQGVVPLYQWIWKHFGPKGVVLTKVGRFELYVDCKDWFVAPSLLFGHIWEPAETEIFRLSVKAGMTVVDIGAHVGYYSILASQLVGPTGQVYAFEPTPETLKLLHQNMTLNQVTNVQVLAAAVSDGIGTTLLYLDKVSPGSNTTSGGSSDKAITVSTITLDSILGDTKVDFIKIDIEGGEVKALKGMTKTIENNPNLQLMTEVYPDGLKRANSSLEEYIDLLQQFFELYLICQHGQLLLAKLENIKRATKIAGSINLLCMRV